MTPSMLLPTLALFAAGMPAPAAASPAVQDTVYRVGEFNQIDANHWAQGRVAIFRTAEGALVLAFAEEFAAADGPDLYVVLSTHEAPTRGRDLGNYVELKSLVQTSGAQVFVIPESVDPTTVGSVVIYCKRFDVLFSVASLSTPGASDT